jgi:hypothetical protein
MPIEVSCVDNGIGVLHIGAGIVTGQDVLESKYLTFSSPEMVRQYRYGLIDYARVDDLDMSGKELEAVAALDKKAALITPGACVAIVAVRDSVFGLARMWDAYMHGAGWDTHVFRAREQAEDWIRAQTRNKYGVEPSFT